MSKGNRASVDVDLLRIDAEFLDAVYTLGRECFVDLPKYEIGQTEQPKQTSNKSTSSCVMPAFFNTIGMAYKGPIPIIRGATPDPLITIGSTMRTARYFTGHCSANEFCQNG